MKPDTAEEKYKKFKKVKHAHISVSQLGFFFCVMDVSIVKRLFSCIRCVFLKKRKRVCGSGLSDVYQAVRIDRNSTCKHKKNVSKFGK